MPDSARQCLTVLDSMTVRAQPSAQGVRPCRVEHNPSSSTRSEFIDVVRVQAIQLYTPTRTAGTVPVYAGGALDCSETPGPRGAHGGARGNYRLLPTTQWWISYQHCSLAFFGLDFRVKCSKLFAYCNLANELPWPPTYCTA